MSALDALLALARSFGAAGKRYTDLSFSDEFVATYEAVEVEAGGRVGRASKEGVEAAFREGRREWRQGGGWKNAWTTAPVEYDGFGTETAEGPFEWEGRQLRRVLVDPEFYGWQTGRYPVCWDEDPREVEARIQAKIAAEKAEREAREQRRAEGLVWIRTAVVDGDDDAVDEEARAHGLGWEDVRAERRRRAEEKVAADRAAKWKHCRAAFRDGDTLLDDGAPSREGSYGFRIPGREPAVHHGVVVRPHYAAKDDAEQAAVLTESGDGIGMLVQVAYRLTHGELRLMREGEVVPPRAVLTRLGCSWKDVARVEVDGRVAWVARPTFASEPLVLDDAGHLVRAKRLREAAEAVWREVYIGGLELRSFRLFECAHAQSRSVRFVRDGVDSFKLVSVCTSCGACRVSGDRVWRDGGCLELNLQGEWQESDRAELLADGAPS